MKSLSDFGIKVTLTSKELGSVSSCSTTFKNVHKTKTIGTLQVLSNLFEKLFWPSVYYMHILTTDWITSIYLGYSFLNQFYKCYFFSEFEHFNNIFNNMKFCSIFLLSFNLCYNFSFVIFLIPMIGWLVVFSLLFLEQSLYRFDFGLSWFTWGHLFLPFKTIPPNFNILWFLLLFFCFHILDD